MALCHGGQVTRVPIVAVARLGPPWSNELSVPDGARPATVAQGLSQTKLPGSCPYQLGTTESVATCLRRGIRLR